MNPVADYCRRYQASYLEPESFARHVLHTEPELARRVLDIIGCWPCSEPELRALQRLGP